MIKVDSIEVPIYDMEEFDTYIEDKVKYYTSLHIDHIHGDLDYCDDADIEHTQQMMEHYTDILSYIRSKYTTDNGNLRDEYNEY
jgi:hypothetical protein